MLTPTGRRGRHARLPIPGATAPGTTIPGATAPDRDMEPAGEELPADGEQPAGRRKKSWRQLMLVVVTVIVVMLLIKAFVVQVYRIPSASMEDTLLTGDRVLVNKLVYHVRGIARGDIVVFSGQGSWGTTTGAPDPAPPGNPLVRAMYDVLADVGVYSTQTYYIKRIIGLPGDHVVCCVNGKVTVNKVPLDETSYLFPGASPSVQRFDVIVPPGRLWVMGDNRAISDDSRGHNSADFPAKGTVPENEVAGRAFLIVWPPSQLGDLPIPGTFQQAALHAGASGAPVLQVARPGGTVIGCGPSKDGAREPAVTARGVQYLIAVAVLMGVAACGSVSAGSAGHPASASASASSSRASAAAAGTRGGGPLCANGQRADRVVVGRTASPRQVTLRGATHVQAMVAALCALPAMSAGQHCAAASGGSVRLVFVAGTRSFPPVTVQESGCRSVTGIGPTRSWSGSSQLGVLLDEAVGGLGRLVPGTHPSSVPLGS